LPIAASTALDGAQDRLSAERAELWRDTLARLLPSATVGVIGGFGTFFLVPLATTVIRETVWFMPDSVAIPIWIGASFLFPVAGYLGSRLKRRPSPSAFGQSDP
jgi:hypothetical protein